MNIIILSHIRSLGKATGLIDAEKQHTIIIVCDAGFEQYEKPYLDGVSHILTVDNFNITEITKHIPNCDRIWCISENLLPIQSQLESFYGIDNLNPYTAEILSNKQKFDDHCRQIGLDQFIPKSITPLTETDLDLFEDREFITKPDIGSGLNIFFPESDKNSPLIEYQRWKNKNHFLEHLKKNNCYDKFFQLNKNGVFNKRFNNKPCRIMAQEFHESIVPPITTIGLLSRGKIKYSHWSKISKTNSSFLADPLSTPLESHSISHTAGLTTFRGTWQIDEEIIDTNIREQINYFIETLTNSLKIKNELFFAGPEYFVNKNNQVIAIDFNPRPAGVSSKFEKTPEKGNMYALLNNKPLTDKKKFFFGCSNLKPGVVKKVKSLEHLRPFLDVENIEIKEGTVIPEFQHAYHKTHILNFKILGNSQEELFAKYLKLNQQLQDCIIYEDDNET